MQTKTKLKDKIIELPLSGVVVGGSLVVVWVVGGVVAIFNLRK